MSLRTIKGLCVLLMGMLAGQGWTQSPLDSMELQLKSLVGREKMNLAGELAYQFCFANTDKAVQYGLQELSLAKELNDSLAIAQSWNDLGAAYASKGELKTSIQFSARALGLRHRLGDSLLVANSSNKLGVALLDLGEHDKALDAFLRSARIYEQNEKNALLPSIYNNIGSVHLRQGNNAKALEYLQKCLKVSEEVGDQSSIISAKCNMAGIDFEQGNYTGARATYEELLHRMSETGMVQHWGIVQMNLGASLVRLGEYAKGIQNLKAADSIYVIKDDAKGQAMTQVNLAIGYLGLRDTAAARRNLRQAELLCSAVNSDQQWYLLYDGYYRLESAENHPEAAVRYNALANQHRQRIYTERASKQIAEMETKYDTEKKEQALAASELENRNQLLLIAGLMALLVLVIVLGVIVLRNQRLKRETLQQKSTLALQEERLRISRDLHDHIGAELTLISSSVEVATGHDDPVLQEISGFARNAMGQLRETVWAIRNESIAVDAFADRLRDYASRLCAPVRMALQVQVQGEAGRVLSPTGTLQLYRLCQEAVHNAVKYSQSATLDIVIVANATQVAVTITDKGIGFDVATRSSGYGLGNMKARAAEQGGTVQVTSAQGNGTVVHVMMPC